MDMVGQFRHLLLGLAQLETSVGDIQKYFHTLFREEKLSHELALLEDEADRKGWRARAAESIRLVFTIHRHQRVAHAVQGAEKALGMDEPFSVVERILSSSGDDASFRRLPLKQVLLR